MVQLLIGKGATVNDTDMVSSHTLNVSRTSSIIITDMHYREEKLLFSLRLPAKALKPWKL